MCLEYRMPTAWDTYNDDSICLDLPMYILMICLTKSVNAKS